MDLDNLNSFVKRFLGRDLTEREVLMLNEAIDRYGFDIDLAREGSRDYTTGYLVFAGAERISKSNLVEMLHQAYELKQCDSGQHEQLLNDCRCLKCRMGKLHQCTTRKPAKRESN